MDGTVIAIQILRSIVSMRAKHRNMFVAHRPGELRETALVESEIELATAALIALIILLGILFLADLCSSFPV
jgi:hypothetical protein